MHPEDFAGIAVETIETVGLAIDFIIPGAERTRDVYLAVFTDEQTFTGPALIRQFGHPAEAARHLLAAGDESGHGNIDDVIVAGTYGMFECSVAGHGPLELERGFEAGVVNVAVVAGVAESPARGISALAGNCGLTLALMNVERVFHHRRDSAA